MKCVFALKSATLLSLNRLALIALVGGSSLVAQPPRPESSSTEGFVHRAGPPRDASRAQAIRAMRDAGMPHRKVLLRPLNSSESNPVSHKAGLPVAGVRRELPADVLANGEWKTTAEGRNSWRIGIASAGADSLRVQFAEFDAGTGQVWLLGSDDKTLAGPYTGKGPHGTGQFWSDLVAGESVVVYYEPPDDATAMTVPFRPVAVTHLFATGSKMPAAAASPVPATDAGGTSTRLATAASCAVDVACYPQYNDPASAVAMMIFESEGQSYRCSGSLVSSRAEPSQPLFLTANHCIGTGAEANSLIAFFNYQTSACNGIAPTLASSPRVTGATLLQTQPMALGDFSLLRLTAFPNVDVKVLGWYSAEIAANERVIGISHPLGDYKRIAIGQRTRDAAIRFSDGDQMPAAKGLQVTWFQGLTQGGSSGSPLLAEINGAEYLVGTLSAGPAVNENNDRQVCSTRNLIASYGRFAAAFPYLEPYLTASPAPSSVDAGRVSFSAAAGKNGTAILTWSAPGHPAVQIRVLSPAGPAMTGIEGTSGTAVTGDWVTNGMQFYLQDASGDSASPDKTLATIGIKGLSR